MGTKEHNRWAWRSILYYKLLLYYEYWKHVLWDYCLFLQSEFCNSGWIDISFEYRKISLIRYRSSSLCLKRSLLDARLQRLFSTVFKFIYLLLLFLVFTSSDLTPLELMAESLGEPRSHFYCRTGCPWASHGCIILRAWICITKLLWTHKCTYVWASSPVGLLDHAHATT